MKKRGFTLIELVVVIILIGVIGVVTIPAILDSGKASKETIKTARIETIKEAAKNYVNDNINQYGYCNSLNSQEGIASDCTISIQKLIDDNYLDADKNQSTIIDPTTNEEISGSLLVCYNMNTGQISTEYYENMQGVELCAETGTHVLALQDNSVAMSYHENKTFTTQIYKIGDFTKLELTSNGSDGVQFEIVNNEKLRVTYTGKNDLLSESKTISTTINGYFNGSEKKSVTFNVLLYENKNEQADQLSIILRPSQLFKNTTSFNNDITLTCTQNNEYGCEIDIKNASAYTNINTINGYSYIDYSLNSPIENYYEYGNGQNGNVSARLYRIYNTATSPSTNPSLKSGSILYINIKPISYTLTFNPNGGSVSPSSRSIVYTKTLGQTIKETNGIKSLENVNFPTPSKSGNIFDGWLNADGASVSTSTVVSSNQNVTIYAKWLSKVTISVSGGSSNATTRNIAAGGSTTFTITPDSIHKLSGGTVSCTGGGSGSLNTSNGVLTVSNVTSETSCSVTLPVAYYCPSGTLTYNNSYGYICTKPSEYYSYYWDCSYTTQSCSTVSGVDGGCVGNCQAAIGDCSNPSVSQGCSASGYDYICSNACSYSYEVCTPVTVTQYCGDAGYTCPSGFSHLSGSGSSMICYKAASQGR